MNTVMNLQGEGKDWIELAPYIIQQSASRDGHGSGPSGWACGLDWTGSERNLMATSHEHGSEP
jgi:hypothetical protein